MGTEEAFRAATADHLQYGMGKESVGSAYWTNGTATLPNKRDMNIELPWIEFMPSKQLAFESVCLKDHGLMGLKVTAL